MDVRKKGYRKKKMGYEVKNKEEGRNKAYRAGALVLAVLLAVPGQIYAKESEGQQGELQPAADTVRVEQELYHVHIGEETEGSGCYTKAVRHVHDGNAGEGGGCYEEPVYHVHTGSETEGGGCYGEEKYHIHTGDGTKGGGCYGEAVYHSHTGSAVSGGGCYGEIVYHSHTGSAASGGGCYGKAVYHSHTGSAASGGGCYGRAVYHSHTGNASSGGGCYTAPVYHTHEGNEASGGNCYQPVYHTHTSACYTTETCTATYEGDFQRLDEYDEYCYHHGETLHMTFEGTFNHKSCGKGRGKDRKTICWACHNMDITHQYQKAICGKTEETIEGYVLACGKGNSTIDAWSPGCGKNEQTITGYEINCGKNTSTVEGYQINCGRNEKSVDAYRQNCQMTEKTVAAYKQNCNKTEETIDSYERNCEKDETSIDAYALSCGRTEETIDGYERDCGREENISYAVFSLSNKSSGWSSGTVELQAVYEDKDGFLQLAENPFLWGDRKTDDGEKGDREAENAAGENGNACYGNNRCVSENGVYTVRLMVENEDISERDPVLSIEVKNIDKTAPVIHEILYDRKENAEKNEIHVTAEDIQPDGSRGSGLPQKAYSYDGGKTWVADSVHPVKENGTVEIAVRDACGNIARESIEISNIRSSEELDDGNRGDNGKEDSEKDSEKGDSGDSDPKDTDEKEDSEDGNNENNAEKEDSEDGNDENNGRKEDSGNDEPGDNDRENGTGSDSDRDGSGDGDSDNESNGENGTGGSSNIGQSGVSSDGDKPAEEKQPEKKAKKIAEGNTEKETGGTSDSTDDKKRSIGIRPSFPTEERAGGKKVKTEEETVKQPEVKAEPVLAVHPETVKRTADAAPVVKAITFTVSGVALAAVLLFLFYMMLRSIRVYHQDGEGGSRFAGSYMMKKTENGFEVKIPDTILEQSATGQFILRTGKVFAKRHRGEELVVLAGRRKEAVWIDSEIPLKLATFV